MRNKELDNLVKIGELKAEPFSQSEFDACSPEGHGRQRLYSKRRSNRIENFGFPAPANAAW
jgi:hypothetical protein